MAECSNHRLPTIHLVHGSETEQTLKAQLVGLFARYNLSKWQYADTVYIEDGVLPNSIRSRAFVR